MNTVRIHKYKVVSYDPATKATNLEYQFSFDSLEELLYSVARNVKTHGYADSERWTSDIIDNLNVCGSDRHFVYEFTFGHYYKDIPLRDVMYIDNNGSIIDVRKYWSDIVKIVHAMESGAILKDNYPTYRFHRKQYPKRHTTYSYKRHTKQALRASYQLTEEDTCGYTVRNHIPRNALENCWDTYGSRSSTGWKSKKVKHQWQHRLPKDYSETRKLKKHVYDIQEEDCWNA